MFWVNENLSMMCHAVLRLETHKEKLDHYDIDINIIEASI